MRSNLRTSANDCCLPVSTRLCPGKKSSGNLEMRSSHLPLCHGGPPVSAWHYTPRTPRRRSWGRRQMAARHSRLKSKSLGNKSDGLAFRLFRRFRELLNDLENRFELSVVFLLHLC